jgi:hypothetical protein
MSTDVRPQAGQTPAAGRDPAPAPAGGQNAPALSLCESPQTLIQESIKYRRRAQEAERRAEALEAELANLRETQEGRADAVEVELAQARAEADTLRGRLEGIERDRLLERELVRAGCVDPETALAVARERLSAGAPPEDLAAFARGLLEEKPHLRGEASPRRGDTVLPPPTAGAKPAGDDAPRRAAERLADRARQTGSPRDLAAYMRLRRGVRP